jgi:hypothetical protein
MKNKEKILWSSWGESSNENKGNSTLFKISNSNVCSICGHEFFGDEYHAKFCDNCREHSESYKFADWLVYG